MELPPSGPPRRTYALTWLRPALAPGIFLHASIDLLGPNRNDRLILICWGKCNGRSYAPIHMHVILICWDEHTCFALPPLTHPPHPNQYLSHTFHFSWWNTLRPVLPGGHSWLPVAVYRRHGLSTESNNSNVWCGLQSRQATDGYYTCM